MLSSISDYPGYTEFCRRAAEDDGCFAGFREDPVYSAVVTSQLHYRGRDYFEMLEARGFDPGFFAAVRDHDRIGGATLASFGAAGDLAPQTMRYVKVLSDLEQLFGSLDGASIIEIGGGFGGQCAVIAKRFGFARYTIVDLREPLMLARRYLDALAIPNVAYELLEALPINARYDLVISCYGLSELARPFQVMHLQRVLLRARAGYLLWNNEGMKPHRDWQEAFLGGEMIYCDELLPLLPGARLADESWLALEDRQLDARLILWGTR
ncbi:MAG TPA: putative sugar O-methyltransferase [Candidatus Sulfotelmatobacter sp.]|nr:putative sugar O-methyltransferase [Candidatus Sulfotelmatobacter sp.]